MQLGPKVSIQLGPNMRRLREMDVADSVRACVIAGPGDLMTWEVSASVDTDGMTLSVVGRGTDLEAAAACAMAVLTENGSTVEATPQRDSARPTDGDRAV